MVVAEASAAAEAAVAAGSVAAAADAALAAVRHTPEAALILTAPHHWDTLSSTCNAATIAQLLEAAEDAEHGAATAEVRPAAAWHSCDFQARFTLLLPLQSRGGVGRKRGPLRNLSWRNSAALLAIAAHSGFLYCLSAA